MKKDVFLAVTITLLVSGCLWVAQRAQGAWSAPSDGMGPDDAAAEYALTAGEDEPAKGTILFEYYWGADGTISSLESLPTFPNYADDREWRASLEGPTDWRDHYGTYVRGYLYPPATGSYTFWIASDDQSQLPGSGDDSDGYVRTGRVDCAHGSVRPVLRIRSVPLRVDKGLRSFLGHEPDNVEHHQWTHR